VCTNCNCEVFHLTYQEKLWAESDVSDKNKKSKKSKKQKKKDKKKKSKAKILETGFDVKCLKCPPPNEESQGTEDDGESVTKSSSISDDASTFQPVQFSNEQNVSRQSSDMTRAKLTVEANSSDVKINENPHKESTSTVDFVLYLQQTGSILALAKLMDALDAGEDVDEYLGYDLENDLDLMMLPRTTQMKSVAH